MSGGAGLSGSGPNGAALHGAPLSDSDVESIVARFEHSEEFAVIRDDLMQQFMQSGGMLSVNERVERLITADLESNPRLINALISSGVDDSTTESRLTTIFERRVRSEVEAGMTGKLFDDFVAARSPEVTRAVAEGLKIDRRE